MRLSRPASQQPLSLLQFISVLLLSSRSHPSPGLASGLTVVSVLKDLDSSYDAQSTKSVFTSHWLNLNFYLWQGWFLPRFATVVSWSPRLIKSWYMARLVAVLVSPKCNLLNLCPPISILCLNLQISYSMPLLTTLCEPHDRVMWVTNCVIAVE